jgi:hypothetical protein
MIYLVAMPISAQSNPTSFEEPQTTTTDDFGTSKKRADHEFSPQCSNSPSVEPNILPEDPETSILYLRHGIPSVEEATGNRVQDRYN